MQVTWQRLAPEPLQKVLAHADGLVHATGEEGVRRATPS